MPGKFQKPEDAWRARIERAEDKRAEARELAACEARELLAEFVAVAALSLETLTTSGGKFSNVSPDLVSFVARCVKRWMEANFAADASLAAFNVARPVGAPPQSDLADRHASAVADVLVAHRVMGKPLDEAKIAGAVKWDLTLAQVNRAYKSVEVDHIARVALRIPPDLRAQALTARRGKPPGRK